MSKKVLPGINIQWPWSELLINGEKIVETRSYPIPEKYIGKELAVIETPGPRGKKEAGIEKARIIGTITFESSFQYKSKKEWQSDKGRHCVDEADKLYGFSKEKDKWGWVVSSKSKLKPPKIPPDKRGIVFAKKCEI